MMHDDAVGLKHSVPGYLSGRPGEGLTPDQLRCSATVKTSVGQSSQVFSSLSSRVNVFVLDSKANHLHVFSCSCFATSCLPLSFCRLNNPTVPSAVTLTLPPEAIFTCHIWDFSMTSWNCDARHLLPDGTPAVEM